MTDATAKNFVPLRSDVNNPAVRSAREEWRPHARMSEKSTEWWYVTFIAFDGEGNRYFILLAIMHYSGEGWHKRLSAEVAPEGRVVTMTASIFDYKRDDYRFISEVNTLGNNSLWNEGAHAIESTIGKYTTFWSYAENSMRLMINSTDVSLDFEFLNVNEVAWHKDKLGVRGLIQQGTEGDLSFYYSLMRAPVHGSISFGDSTARRTVQLAGTAWIDRQWGDFYTLFWEWSSFRFSNGARLHLYSFYNGRQEAVYLNAEGQVQYFDSFVVKQNGYAKSPVVGVWVSWGWSCEFPVEIEGSRRYTVEPYSRKEFVENLAIDYALYEGPCRLVNDDTGEQVGVTVNESADIRQMNNGPHAQNQH